MFPELDQITLSSSHAIMMQSVPSGADLGKTKWGESVDIGTFGLFDSSSPNYTTFYPDVTPEHFNPKEEDFINPVFRLLSETTVHKNWNPISFAKPGVLQASMKKLVGQAVNIDHETSLGNAIGSVAETYWQEAYTTTLNGKEVTIPAGINGRLKIDAKSNPRIARGILMEPPSIHSNSVTIHFKWEQSHPEMEREAFFDKLGTYDEDGRLIQRVANEIVMYSETSLVGHGADPYAQIVNKDGVIKNPEFATSRNSGIINSYQKALQRDETPRTCYDYKTCALMEQSLNSSDTTLIHSINNNSNIKNKSMHKDIIALAVLLGLSFDENTPEDQMSTVLEAISDESKELLKLKDQVTSLQDDKTDLETKLGDKTTELETLQADVTKNALFVEIGQTALTDTRADAVRLYKTLKGENANKSVIETIENASFEAAKGFKEQYESELETDPSKRAKGGSNDEQGAVEEYNDLKERLEKRRLNITE